MAARLPQQNLAAEDRKIEGAVTSRVIPDLVASRLSVGYRTQTHRDVGIEYRPTEICQLVISIGFLDETSSDQLIDTSDRSANTREAVPWLPAVAHAFHHLYFVQPERVGHVKTLNGPRCDQKITPAFVLPLGERLSILHHSVCGHLFPVVPLYSWLS